MPAIPDGSVDMICCDLPYGDTAASWDTRLPLDKLWEEYRRVTKVNSAIVLFAGNKFSKQLAVSNLKEYRYDWVWHKNTCTGFLNSHFAPMVNHELILVFYRKKPKFNPQGLYHHHKARNGWCTSSEVYGDYHTVERNVSGYSKSVLTFPAVYKGKHSTQKPVDLITYLVKTYSDEGDLVLDNCMGSGTTAVACEAAQRRWIGIEKEEKFFNTARERLSHAVHLDAEGVRPHTDLSANSQLCQTGHH